MNYFKARRAEKLFRKYKELTLAYWKAKPPDERDWFEVQGGVEGPESTESQQLREQVNLLFPEVNILASRLGIGVIFESYPAPAVGGPIIPVNVLLSVIDQEMGHRRLPEQRILDLIDRCIGTAELTKKEALQRLHKPWYWIIDIPAFLIRIPFLILRAAGLPRAIEENIISQVIKVVLLIATFIVLGYFGFRASLSDLVNLLRK